MKRDVRERRDDVSSPNQPNKTRPMAPSTFYAFEIVRTDGGTSRVVISDEGVFCSAPTDALELRVDPSRS